MKARVAAPRAFTRAANAARGVEHTRRVHELEVHQLELEMQNHELRQAQSAVEEARTRYAELYDYAPSAHLTLDERGVIRELNLACAALLGRDRRALQGNALAAFLVPPAQRPALQAHLRRCAVARQAVAVELGVLLPDGAARAVEIVSVPSAGAAPGGPRLYHSTVSPSGHGHVDELKDSVLAVVAHELRAPLGAMHLWVQALRPAGARGPRRSRALDAIETCLKMELAMVDDLFELSRGRRGLRLELRPTSLHGAARDAVVAFAPVMSERRISLTIDGEAAPTPVLGDRVRLQQLVGNLLSNAAKFVPEGGQVHVSVAVDGVHVVLEVVDDGPGVEPSLLEAIFEPFHQYGARARQPSDGLGLGLAIVRQIVQQHGGAVTASPARATGGLRVTVTLPRLDESVRGPN